MTPPAPKYESLAQNKLRTDCTPSSGPIPGIETTILPVFYVQTIRLLEKLLAWLLFFIFYCATRQNNWFGRPFIFAGQIPPDPSPRNLRMYHDRGRSGWRRIAVSGTVSHGNDGDGGSGSGGGSGGDGKSIVWEWNGRRVVLQVSPTAKTPAAMEIPRPAAEPDEGEFAGAHTPRTPLPAFSVGIRST